jgi:hypothetical protein
MSDNGGGRAPETGEEEQEEAVDSMAMEAIRQALLKTTLEIRYIEGDSNGIFENARSFVKLSQGNNSVQDIVLYVYQDYHQDYNALRVLGKGFGNLEALQVLTIRFRSDSNPGYEYEGNASRPLYWQAFTGAMGRLRHNIELRVDGEDWDDKLFDDFVLAIQGVSTIRTFHSGARAVCHLADTFMSALASLPSLENVTLAEIGLE